MKMKKILLITITVLFLTVPSLLVADETLTLNNTPTRVCFSPKGNCTQSIVREIDNARSEILIQAYSFTSDKIAKAMVNAHKRGVRVKIILDKSNRTVKYSAGDFTAHMGVTTYYDTRHAIAHNKVMIIDRETVITGSFNFTKAAEERNAENLLIMKNMDLAKIYIENWEKHREHSEPYEGR